MGRGGGGGGGGGGGSRYRKIPGFSRIFGPCRDTNEALRHLAIGRGIRDIDVLLLPLGKNRHEISLQESLDMLEKEVGLDAYSDFLKASLYKPGKGYGPCNRLLEAYLKNVKDKSATPGHTDIQLDKLKKYCSYTDYELRSVMLTGAKGSGCSRYRYIPGFSRLFGPCPDTMNALQHVAVARGLRNADELLLCLGKESHEISHEESIDLLEMEVGVDACSDLLLTSQFKSGKGYGPCNRLLEEYLKNLKDKSVSPGFTAIQLDGLKKYCSYTNDELRSFR